MSGHADVAIVGAGIIGCGIAAELAGRGAKVVLVERAQIAAAASGRNHGLLLHPGDASLEPLAAASTASYRELAETSRLDLALDAEPFGLVIVASTEEDWDAAEREASGAARGGCAVERLDEGGLRSLEPALARALGGFLVADGYRVDPSALTLAMAEKARDSGAEIRTFAEAKQVLAKDGSVRGIAADEGVIAAPVVVDAAGPWAAKLARTASVGGEVPIGGARGWLLLTEARPGLLHHLAVSAGWHLAAGDPGPGAVTVADLASGPAPGRTDLGTLVQQNRDGHILLGGSRAPSLMDEPEGRGEPREIARRAAALVPALASVPVLSVWSGVRPTSPDGRPLIGWLPGVRGLFVAGGHGGQGVVLGGGSARLAAELILGETPFTDPSPFDPGRFGVARREGS